MAIVDLIMPKMGESIMEATILKWEKKVGDTIEIDEDVLMIATDKVDTEIPSPVAGVLQEILFEEGAVVEVGKVIARIASEGTEIVSSPSIEEPEVEKVSPTNGTSEGHKPQPEPVVTAKPATASLDTSASDRFYSPLVKSIAQKEGISIQELEAIPGSGAKGRVTKKDMISFVENRGKNAPVTSVSSNTSNLKVSTTEVQSKSNVSGNVEIIEMDRMRRLIADHMVNSKKTSPHVTSFVEADVTNLVNWRNKVKVGFQKEYGEKITFTPLFVEALVKALKDFPLVNSSVDGNNIIIKKDINIGMAAATPTGHLIVPVIKNADYLNIVGLTKRVNDLAKRARENKLKPDDIQGGTFTLTNVGTFGNLSGTPIINQPQVAIMATGTIKKKPAVLETEYGDVIAIRQLMMISLSYDHRIVDGFLGGSFLRKFADYLEEFDPNREL